MRLASFSIAAVFTVFALTTVGCAAGASDDAEASEAAALTAAPVTLQNFLTHPKIKEVRAEVAAVNAASLTTVQKDHSCDDTEAKLSKLTDGGNTIRKIFDTWGGSDGDGSTSYYYDAAGRLRFVFDVLESAPASGSLTVFETRSYFDASGRLLIQVGKTGHGTTAHPPNMDNVAFEIATPSNYQTEIIEAAKTNPAGFYDNTVSCGD
jgi:hypothetical protein